MLSVAGSDRKYLLGVGHLLSEAILANDYAMIQGIIFFLIVAIALATFILDLFYPLLDPRVAYR